MANHTQIASHARQKARYCHWMSDLADRILEILLEDPRSDAALARAVGVTRATINDWKQGRTKNLRNENLFALADATGYAARWIATGAGPKRVERKAPDVEIIENALARMNPDVRQSFVDMAQRVAEAAPADYVAIVSRDGCNTRAVGGSLPTANRDTIPPPSYSS